MVIRYVRNYLQKGGIVENIGTGKRCYGSMFLKLGGGSPLKGTAGQLNLSFNIYLLLVCCWGPPFEINPHHTLLVGL